MLIDKQTITRYAIFCYCRMLSFQFRSRIFMNLSGFEMNFTAKSHVSAQKESSTTTTFRISKPSLCCSWNEWDSPWKNPVTLSFSILVDWLRTLLACSSSCSSCQPSCATRSSLWPVNGESQKVDHSGVQLVKLMSKKWLQ